MGLLFRVALPITPILWYDHSGKDWRVAKVGGQTRHVIHKLVDDYNANRLRHIDDHHNAAGIAEGIDFPATLAVLYSKRVRGNPSLKGAVETVLTAGCWTAQRIHDLVSTEYPVVCPRCGQDAETDLHWIYTCPCNADICDDLVLNTQDLVPEARLHALEHPASVSYTHLTLPTILLV